MKWGMPTLLELDQLSQQVALCQELGLDFIEINLNEPKYQTNTLDWDELKLIQDQSGLFFTLHLDEFISIADPNERIAQAYLTSVIDALKMAKALSIPCLTMHFLKGVVYTLPTQKVYVYDRYRDFYMKRIKRFRQAVETELAGSDIKLCIENTEGFEPFMQEGLRVLLESPHFALTYDSGHIERYDQLDLAFMEANQQKIAHVHLHDVIDRRDHLPLGQGHVKLEKHLKLVQPYVKQILIEVKTVEGLRQSMDFIRNQT